MRTVLTLIALVLTGIALSLLITRPTTTFTLGDHGELVVACHTVVGAADGSPQPLLRPSYRSLHFDITDGKDLLDAYKKQSDSDETGWLLADERIEAQCDRRRTGRVAGSAVLLAPAVLLGSAAFALPAVRRATRTSERLSS